MLWNASAINGYVISATDGDVGTICDFLFDDSSWQVRWVVVDTGKWLSGRKVLLPPSVLGHPDMANDTFSVRLTMREVKNNPDIDTDLPVSRQMETNIYDYYGWNPYWSGTGLFMGGYGYGGGSAYPLPVDAERDEIIEAQRDREDPHLRSVEAVTGYHIRATDGEIGHVEDFLVQDADWSIHYLVVDTKNWWPGKKVLISPRSARLIDWTNRHVTLDVDRKTVKDSPPYEPSVDVDRIYETNFNNYYKGIGPDH